MTLVIRLGRLANAGGHLSEEFPVGRLVVPGDDPLEHLRPVAVPCLGADGEPPTNGPDEPVDRRDVLARALEHVDDAIALKHALKAARHEDGVSSALST